MKSILTLYTCFLFCHIGLTAQDITADVSPSTGSTGAIDLHVNAGFEPFDFEWYEQSDPTTIISNSEDLTDLAPGRYCVTVTDALCGIAEMCWEVVLECNLELASDVQPASCIADDGSISVSLIGNMEADDFIWDDIGSGASIRENLAPGQYCVTVVFDECTVPECYDIVREGPVTTINLSADITNTSNPQQTDGSIDLHIAGGMEPYSFEWYNPLFPPIVLSTSEDRLSLPEGQYCVRVTDLYCGYGEMCFEVDHECNLSLESEVNAASCMADDGSISVSLVGIFSGSTFTWDDIGIGSAVRQDLAPGQYCVTARVDDCTVRACYDIVREELDISIRIEDITRPDFVKVEDCDVVTGQELDNGSITISLFPPNNNYEIAWSNGSTGPIGQTGLIASNLTSGTYIVTVSDGLCEKEEAIFLFACQRLVNSGLVNKCQPEEGYDFEGIYEVVLDNKENVSFAEPCVGFLEISVKLIEGIGSVIEGHWSGPNGFYSTSSDIYDLCEGQYCYFIDNGCSQEEEYCFNIVNCDINPITFTGETTVACPSYDVGTITLSISGGRPPYDVEWDVSGVTGASPTDLSPGEYCAVVSDADLCIADEVCFTVNSQNTITQESSIPCGISALCGEVEVDFDDRDIIPLFDDPLNCNRRRTYCSLTEVLVDDRDLGYKSFDTDFNSCIYSGTCQTGIEEPLYYGNSFEVVRTEMEGCCLQCVYYRACVFNGPYGPFVQVDYDNVIRFSRVEAQLAIGHCDFGECYFDFYCADGRYIGSGCDDCPPGYSPGDEGEFSQVQAEENCPMTLGEIIRLAIHNGSISANTKLHLPIGFTPENYVSDILDFISSTGFTSPNSLEYPPIEEAFDISAIDLFSFDKCDITVMDSIPNCDNDQFNLTCPGVTNGTGYDISHEDIIPTNGCLTGLVDGEWGWLDADGNVVSNEGVLVDFETGTYRFFALCNDCPLPLCWDNLNLNSDCTDDVPMPIISVNGKDLTVYAPNNVYTINDITWSSSSGDILSEDLTAATITTNGMGTYFVTVTYAQLPGVNCTYTNYYLFPDSDGDDISDINDDCPTYYDPTNCCDIDGDGLCLDVDPCPGDPTNSCVTDPACCPTPSVEISHSFDGIRIFTVLFKNANVPASCSTLPSFSINQVYSHRSEPEEYLSIEDYQVINPTPQGYNLGITIWFPDFHIYPVDYVELNLTIDNACIHITTVKRLYVISSSVSNIYNRESTLGKESPLKPVITRSKNNTNRELTEMQIYPNPFKDDITIELSNSMSDQVVLSIYDVHGKVVHLESMNLTKPKTQKKLDMKDFSTGIYFLSITDRDGQTVKTERLIKY